MRSVWLILCKVAWLLVMCQISFGQKPELIVQTRQSSVRLIAVSPDKKTFASSDSSIIKLWDLKTGKELRSILTNPFSIGVSSIDFSPDGKILAGGHESGRVVLWDTETGKQLKTFDLLVPEHLSELKIAFNPDGKTLAIIGSDTTQGFVQRSGKILLWNLESNKPERSFSGHTSQIASIGFSSDGKFLASAGWDKTVKLWNVATGKEIALIFRHNDFVNAVTFIPNGKVFASGGYDNLIKIWDAETGRELHTLVGHSQQIESLAFSPNGKVLASSSADKTIKLWDVERGQALKTFTGHLEKVKSVRFSQDGEVLISCSEDRSIRFWDLKNLQELKILSGRPNAIWDLAISPDGKLIANSNLNGSIRLWNLEKGIAEPKQINTNAFISLSFSPDGKSLVSSGSDDRLIQIWDINKMTETKKIEGNSSSGSGRIWKAAFSPDGKILANIGADSDKIQLWDAVDFSELTTLQLTKGTFKSFAFSLDGKTLAAGTAQAAENEKTLITIWDVESGKLLKEFVAHDFDVETLAPSPDRKTFASASSDRIKIWDWVSGKLLKEFDVNNDPGTIKDISFSPDGRLIASVDGQILASIDFSQGNINIWEVESGRIIKTIPGHFKSIKSIKFNPDGKILVSGGKDGTIKIWDTSNWNELCTLIATDDNDWLVTTPEGFFDGTPGAWRQLIWRFNNNTFDYAAVETYFNDFFYPNLLQDILAGKSPKAPAGSELEKKDRRQPKVEIVSTNPQSDQRTAKIIVKVTDNTVQKNQPDHHQSSGAQDVRLFRNGSLVKIWHGDVLEGKSEIMLETEVPIVAGENNLTAYAFNSNNVKSSDASVSITGGDSLKRDGTLYVLAIGVNDYAPLGKSNLDLNFAVPDVEEITKVLKSQQDQLIQDSQLKQYAKTEIITLTDADATKENILLALRRFSEGEQTRIPANSSDKLKAELFKIKPTQPEDGLIIQFSGHGASRGQRFYLLPHNFTDPKEIEHQAVSDLELNQVLEKVDAGRLLMIIDACQSGQALGEQWEGRAPMNSKGLAQLAYDKGMLILTAALSQQAALEAVRLGDKEIKHGLLTYALLEAMRNPEVKADTDDNRQLWEREWFDYAVEQVPLMQLEAMKQRRKDLQTGVSEVKGKSELVYLNGDNPQADPEKRRVQTPRVFYRRETETKPMIVAKP